MPAGLSHGTAAYQADPHKKQKEAPLRMSLPEKMAQVRGIFPFGAYGEIGKRFLG